MFFCIGPKSVLDITP